MSEIYLHFLPHRSTIGWAEVGEYAERMERQLPEEDVQAIAAGRSERTIYFLIKTNSPEAVWTAAKVWLEEMNLLDGAVAEIREVERESRRVWPEEGE